MCSKPRPCVQVPGASTRAAGSNRRCMAAINIGASTHGTQGPASRSAAIRRPHTPRPARRALTRYTRARHRCGLSCVLLLTPWRIAGITTSTSRTHQHSTTWQARVRTQPLPCPRASCCPACGLALSPLLACSPAASRSRAESHACSVRRAECATQACVCRHQRRRRRGTTGRSTSRSHAPRRCPTLDASATVSYSRQHGPWSGSMSMASVATCPSVSTREQTSRRQLLA